MGINGLLTDVRWEWTGTELTADLLTGETVLPVLDPESITAGEFVWVAGTGPYEITGVDVDAATFTITPGLSADADNGTEVALDIGGQPGRVWVCEVILPDADGPVEVPLVYTDLLALPEGTFDPPVAILLSDDLNHVLDLPGQMPMIDGALIDPETLPEPVITDLLPPDEEPVLTFIGGIGSLFFRWTEITNNDPVTYRLHVRAGSAPTTDGTYEVAAGVGLTFAAVRKLADGTAVVGDGTVTYYGVVTVEDADGPNPTPSNTASGIPAQVNHEDIAVDALSADLLTANDAFIDALKAVDLTGVQITGAIIQTREDPERGVKIGSIGEEEGLFVYDNAGNPFLTAIPDSGMAVVAGEVKAETLSVADGSSLAGITEISRGRDGAAGAVRLTAYTTAPKSAPTVSVSYETFFFKDFNPAGVVTRNFGAATDGTNWYTVRGVKVGAVWTWYVYKWALQAGSTDTYEMVSSAQFADGDWLGASLAYHSGKLHLVYNKHADDVYYRTLTTATMTWDYAAKWWPWSDTIAVEGDPRTPGIAVDATNGNIIIAQARISNDLLRVRRHTMDGSGNLTSVSSFDDDVSADQSLVGLAFGNFDYGSSRYVMAGAATTRTRVIFGTTRSTNDEWTGLFSENVGFAYTGTQFAVLGVDGGLRMFTSGQDASTPIGDPKLTKWVSNTLYAMRAATVTTTNASTTVTGASGTFASTDVGSPITGTGIPAGATITAYTNSTQVTISAAATASGSSAGTIGTQTDQSPRAKLAMPKRARLKVNTTAINGTGANAPDRVRIYVGHNASDPAVDPGRTQMAKQTDPAVGVTTMTYSTFVAPPGTNPPATNGFIAAGGTVQRAELADGTLVYDALGESGLVRLTSKRLGSWASASAANVANATEFKVTGWGVSSYTHPFCTAPGAGGSPGGTVTILESGLYLINANLGLATSTAGRRVIILKVNETEVRRLDVGSGGVSNLHVSHVLPLAVNDTVNIYAYQTSGGTLALDPSPGHKMQITRL
jgi:hypothetical protein